MLTLFCFCCRLFISKRTHPSIISNLRFPWCCDRITAGIFNMTRLYSWQIPVSSCGCLPLKPTSVMTSSGEGNGKSLQCSCLGNPMDREACWVTAHGVPKSPTWLDAAAAEAQGLTVCDSSEYASGLISPDEGENSPTETAQMLLPSF